MRIKSMFFCIKFQKNPRYTWPKNLPYLLTSTNYLTSLSLGTCNMISTYVFTLGLSMFVYHFHLEHETNREKCV